MQTYSHVLAKTIKLLTGHTLLIDNRIGDGVYLTPQEFDAYHKRLQERFSDPAHPIYKDLQAKKPLA